MNESPGFSKTDINTGLRGFFYWVVFMGGYWQTALASSPIFVGYVLALGAPESAPSDFISLLYIMGLLQIGSHLVTNHIRNKKLAVIVFGSLEPIVLSAFIFLPMFLPAKTIIALMPFIIMLSAGLYHIGNPLLNAWYGSLIPDSIRASYIGRRIMFSQLTAILCMFAAGKVADMFTGLEGFSIAFAIGIALAISAHLSLIPVRYTPQITERRISFRDILRIPRDDRQFALFSLFFGIWSIGFYIAIPNLNVLMIRHLHLSYSTIAFYTNCQLLLMLAGYSFFPRYIQKYGSKPVMKLILPTLAVAPLAWFFAEPANHPILIPAMMLYGFTASGTILAANTYLFTILPKDNRAPAYMVFWSVIVFGSMALGPKLASIIVSCTHSLYFTAGFLTIMGVKLTFLVVSASFFGAFFVLLHLKEQKPVSARILVDQIFRRNPVSIAYNFFLLDRSKGENIRAYALANLGRTRGAVAFDTLADALDDISPVVRRQAAESLGETRLPEGAAPLAAVLRNPESDIRSEAVSALGMIDTPEARRAVMDSLSDPEPSVRASAIRALGRFEGNDVDERLLELARTETHPITFTALADAISWRRNPAGADLILRGRELFVSRRVRTQILCSLARMFGAGETYYALIAPGGTRAAVKTRKYLERLARRSSEIAEFRSDGMGAALAKLAESFSSHDTAEFLDCVERIAKIAEKEGGVSLAQVARSMRTLVDIKREGRIPNLPGKAFLAVCAGVIVEQMKRQSK
jgi:HEAT repeat protein